MAKLKVQGSATGTGTVTLVAPTTDSTRTITLPDDTQTLIGTNASGNVGIGTTSPATNRKIHTYGLPVIGAKFESTSTSGSGIEFADADTTNPVQIGSDANDFTVDTNFTERMRIDSAGRVTMPYQPSFTATGNSSWQIYSSGSVVLLNYPFHNIGNHYNATNGRFTAPVTGSYAFFVNVYVDTGSYTPRPCLRVNGSQITSSGDVAPYGYNTANTPEGSVSFSIVFRLTQGDYVDLAQRSGYADMRLYRPHSHFSGHLIG